jgi:hypothetical protein
MTIQEKAEKALKFYITKQRDTGESFFTLKDDAPECLNDLNREAHDNMMPDDWRYKFIYEALSAIEGYKNPDKIILEADCYTCDLTEWLHSNNSRVWYLTEAIEQFNPDDGFELLSTAQKIEKHEVLNIVRSRLEEIEI